MPQTQHCPSIQTHKCCKLGQMQANKQHQTAAQSTTRSQQQQQHHHRTTTRKRPLLLQSTQYCTNHITMPNNETCTINISPPISVRIKLCAVVLALAAAASLLKSSAAANAVVNRPMIFKTDSDQAGPSLVTPVGVATAARKPDAMSSGVMMQSGATSLSIMNQRQQPPSSQHNPNHQNQDQPTHFHRHRTVTLPDDDDDDASDNDKAGQATTQATDQPKQETNRRRLDNDDDVAPAAKSAQQSNVSSRLEYHLSPSNRVTSFVPITISRRLHQVDVGPMHGISNQNNTSNGANKPQQQQQSAQLIDTPDGQQTQPVDGNDNQQQQQQQSGQQLVQLQVPLQIHLKLKPLALPMPPPPPPPSGSSALKRRRDIATSHRNAVDSKPKSYHHATGSDNKRANKVNNSEALNENGSEAGSGTESSWQEAAKQVLLLNAIGQPLVLAARLERRAAAASLIDNAGDLPGFKSFDKQQGASVASSWPGSGATQTTLASRWAAVQSASVPTTTTAASATTTTTTTSTTTMRPARQLLNWSKYQLTSPEGLAIASAASTAVGRNAAESQHANSTSQSDDANNSYEETGQQNTGSLGSRFQATTLPEIRRQRHTAQQQQQQQQVMSNNNAQKHSMAANHLQAISLDDSRIQALAAAMLPFIWPSFQASLQMSSSNQQAASGPGGSGASARSLRIRSLDLAANNRSPSTANSTQSASRGGGNANGQWAAIEIKQLSSSDRQARLATTTTSEPIKTSSTSTTTSNPNDYFQGAATTRSTSFASSATTEPTTPRPSIITTTSTTKPTSTSSQKASANRKTTDRKRRRNKPNYLRQSMLDPELTAKHRFRVAPLGDPLPYPDSTRLASSYLMPRLKFQPSISIADNISIVDRIKLATIGKQTPKGNAPDLGPNLALIKADANHGKSSLSFVEPAQIPKGLSKLIELQLKLNATMSQMSNYTPTTSVSKVIRKLPSNQQQQQQQQRPNSNRQPESAQHQPQHESKRLLNDATTTTKRPAAATTTLGPNLARQQPQTPAPNATQTSTTTTTTTTISPKTTTTTPTTTASSLQQTGSIASSTSSPSTTTTATTTTGSSAQIQLQNVARLESINGSNKILPDLDEEVVNKSATGNVTGQRPSKELASSIRIEHDTTTAIATTTTTPTTKPMMSVTGTDKQQQKAKGTVKKVHDTSSSRPRPGFGQARNTSAGIGSNKSNYNIKLFHFKRKPDMNKLPFYKKPLNFTELGWTRDQIQEHLAEFGLNYDSYLASLNSFGDAGIKPVMSRSEHTIAKDVDDDEDDNDDEDSNNSSKNDNDNDENADGSAGKTLDNQKQQGASSLPSTSKLKQARGMVSGTGLIETTTKLHQAPTISELLLMDRKFKKSRKRRAKGAGRAEFERLMAELQAAGEQSARALGETVPVVALPVVAPAAGDHAASQIIPVDSIGSTANSQRKRAEQSAGSLVMKPMFFVMNQKRRQGTSSASPAPAIVSDPFPVSATTTTSTNLDGRNRTTAANGTSSGLIEVVANASKPIIRMRRKHHGEQPIQLLFPILQQQQQPSITTTINDDDSLAPTGFQQLVSPAASDWRPSRPLNWLTRPQVAPSITEPLGVVGATSASGNAKSDADASGKQLLLVPSGMLTPSGSHLMPLYATGSKPMSQAPAFDQKQAQAPLLSVAANVNPMLVVVEPISGEAAAPQPQPQPLQSNSNNNNSNIKMSLASQSTTPSNGNTGDMLKVPKLLVKPMRPAKYSLNGYIPRPSLNQATGIQQMGAAAANQQQATGLLTSSPSSGLARAPTSMDAMIKQQRAANAAAVAKRRQSSSSSSLSSPFSVQNGVVGNGQHHLTPISGKDLDSSTSNEILFSRRRGFHQQQQLHQGFVSNNKSNNSLATTPIDHTNNSLSSSSSNDLNASTGNKLLATNQRQLEENRRKYVQQHQLTIKSPAPLSLQKANQIKAKLGLSASSAQSTRTSKSQASTRHQNHNGDTNAETGTDDDANQGSSSFKINQWQAMDNKQATNWLDKSSRTRTIASDDNGNSDSDANDSVTSINGKKKANLIGAPLSSIPKTDFECTDKKGRFVSGLFADFKTGCQVWHLCSNNRKYSFLCPTGTIFNSKTKNCDWRYNVKCELPSIVSV